MEEPLIIAYYLPQYHPFSQNDKWWGKGFTEWTNVGKAKPLFKGHYQPKVPADLGYYDLRMPEIREQQAELAREAGVNGFCYWHYWFGGTGRQLLNEIIDEVIKTGHPDFPFCFGWANESWKAKQWNKDGTGDIILMEQRYEGIEDYRLHFEYALKAFKDSRYIKIDNKPVFLIYKPAFLPKEFISLWDEWSRQEGFNGIYFIARMLENDKYEDYENKGFQYFTRERKNYAYISQGKFNFLRYRLSSWVKGLKGTAMPYSVCYKSFIDEKEDIQENFIPSIIPNWDHSPRSGKSAFIIYDSEPKYFYQHALDVLNILKKKKNKIAFLKSWNEWGEGNYMEPDLKYGKGYIKALAKAIKDSRK